MLKKILTNVWLYRIVSLIAAFTILFLSIYVQVRRNKQRNSSETFQEVSEEVEEENGDETSVRTSTPSSFPLPYPTREEKESYQDTPAISEIKSYIQEIFVDEKGVAWANCIAYCESRYDAYAENPLGYYGLFQFNPGTYKSCGGVDLWDWRGQVRAAKCMYDSGRQNEFPVCNSKCK